MTNKTIPPDEKQQLASLDQQMNEEQERYKAINALPNPPPALKKQADGKPYKPIWTPV